MNIDYKKIGKRIYETREDKDISQKRLAEMVGMGKTTLNRIEKGNQDIRLDEFFTIAEALGVSPNYLLDQDLVVGNETYLATQMGKIFEARTTKDATRFGSDGVYFPEDICCLMAGDYIEISGKKYLFNFIRKLAEANKIKLESINIYEEQVEKAWKEFCKSKKEGRKKTGRNTVERYFLIPATQLNAIIQEEACSCRQVKSALEEVREEEKS